MPLEDNLKVIIYGDFSYRERIVCRLKKLFKNYSFSLKDYFWNIYHHEDLYKSLAEIRVIDPFKKESLNLSPLLPEIEFERRRIKSRQKIKGIVYEGLRLLNLYRQYLPQEQLNLSYCHIIITEELFATYFDGRYHLRFALWGYPNIISTTGFFEAPAKSKEYYFMKQLNSSFLQENEPSIKKDLYLEEITLRAVIKGILYHLNFPSSCQHKECLLYDPHWQKEIVFQIKNSQLFCPQHKNKFKSFF